jgi:hypothetical protein
MAKRFQWATRVQWCVRFAWLIAIAPIATSLAQGGPASFDPGLTRYYIDPAGSDTSGNGSVSAPWKTLRKATSTVQAPASLIYVNPGIYLETQTSELAVGVSLTGAGNASIIRSTLTATFTPILLAASPEGMNGNQRISNLKFDGQLQTQWGILISGRSNVEVDYVEIVDFFDVGITIRGRSDFNDGPPSVYATGNSFHHNVVTNSANSDARYERGNLQIGGQIGMRIYSNRIVQPRRANDAQGYCIKNSNQGFLKGVKIYDNYFEVPEFLYVLNNVNNKFDFATEFSDVWGLEYYNNTVLGSADQNFQRTDATYPFSVWYHGNTFGRDQVIAKPENGIILEYDTSGAIIENNVFRNVATPVAFVPRAGSAIDNILIRRNLAYNVGNSEGGNYAQGIKIVADQPYTASNWKIHNNTILANSSAPPNFGVDIPAGAGHELINNIVRGFSIGDMHVFAGSNTITPKIQNNNYVRVSPPFPAGAVVSGNTDNVSPNLDAAYRPNPGSPMIDTGINVGLFHSGAAPDVGYFEVLQSPATCTLDFSGNGVLDATDALIYQRWLIGFRDTGLVAGIAPVPAGTTANQYAVAVTARMNLTSAHDFDGNGNLKASTEGLMLMRMLRNTTGVSVTNAAIGVNPARSSWSAIRSHVSTNCGVSFLP